MFKNADVSNRKRLPTLCLHLPSILDRTSPVGMSNRDGLLTSIDHPQLELITVPNHLWCVHPFDGGRQSGNGAGRFGAQAVADAVLAAGEGREEERDSVVAEFSVGAETFPDVAAAMVVQFEAARLVVFQQQVN